MPVKPEQREAALAAVRRNLEGAHSEPGVMKLALHCARDEPDALWFIEVYRDAAAVQAHMQAPYVKAVMAALPQILNGAVEAVRVAPLLFSAHPKGRLAARPASEPAPYVVIADFQIAEGKLESALALLQEEVGPTHAEPGVLTFALHQACDDPNRLVAVEVYRDRAAFEAHYQTPHLRKIARDLPPLWARPIVVTHVEPMPLGDWSKGVL